MIPIHEPNPTATVPETTPRARRHGRPADVQPGTQLDDFDLLLILGQGAFARVFLARQRSMQRLVAVKVSTDSGSEPQTLAQLDHPHIVRVYDQRVLPERGLRLLYMPYLAGGTLRDLLPLVRSTPPAERSGKLLLKAVDAALANRGEEPPTDSITRERIGGMSWPEAVCWLGARLADALAYAHRHGVLHRDLKPANVLLGADASPRLADFNVSSCSELEGADPAESFGGSLPYMSPEQLEAFNPKHDRSPDSLDGRTDLYSLAVTLWELLGGVRPFQSSEPNGERTVTLGEMATRLKAPLDVKTLPANLPPGLQSVLSKCLQYDRENRFANAEELARQLDLCRKPRSRELLLPAPGWRTWVARHPFIALYTVGLIPNLIAALFSIEYNKIALVDAYPAARDQFKLLQVIINGTFFPLCMALFAARIWPVVRGLREASRAASAPGFYSPEKSPEKNPGADTPGSPEDLASLRRRCLRLGPISVTVCIWAWVAAGVIFPIALHLTVQELPMAFHVHFLASQTLCGLIAVSYPQFGVTFLALRCFYPAFVPNNGLTADDLASLRRLDKSQGLYLVLAASVPMLAVGLLASIGSENRIVLAVISVVGLAGFALAYFLTNAIRSDSAALEAATKD